MKIKVPTTSVFDFPRLILGGEGHGVSKNLRDKSDYIVSIPLRGHVNSLNASNAAAIVLFEAARQRRQK